MDKLSFRIFIKVEENTCSSKTLNWCNTNSPVKASNSLGFEDSFHLNRRFFDNASFSEGINRINRQSSKEARKIGC